MKTLLQWIAWPRDEASFIRQAKQIAARCRGPVWERICRLGPTLSPGEQTGYVRARARLVVHRNASARPLGHFHRSAAQAGHVMELALELAVANAVEDLRSSARSQPLVRQVA